MKMVAGYKKLDAGTHRIDMRSVLWPCCKHEIARIVCAAVLLCVSVVLELPLVFITRYVVDTVLPSHRVGALNTIIVILCGAMLVKGGVDILEGYVSSVARQRVIMNLELVLLRHLQNLGVPYIVNAQTGYLVARVTNDSQRIGGLLTGVLLPLVKSLTTLLLASIIVLRFEWRLGVAACLFIPLFAAAVGVFARILRRASTMTQEACAVAWNRFYESVSIMSLVKAFQTEENEAASVKAALEHSIKHTVRLGIYSSWSSYSTAFLAGMGTLVIFGVGGRMVIAGRLSLGTLMAFTVLIGYLFTPIQQLMQIGNEMQTVLGALDRVYELLHERPQVQDPDHPLSVGSIPLGIRFENVSFGYTANALVLNAVTFATDPGRIVAIVGRNGAGKTTLVNLIPRFYDPQTGSIYIGETNIKQWKLADLRKKIGIVPQGALLISGTIRDNIRYGDQKATDEDIVQAAIAAGAYGFISKLAEGLDTRVGERGLTLSGGERQRIAISRALLRNPEILILDEATSEVDTEAEREIQAQLLRLYRRQTTFVIAHRFTTVMTADRIVVLDEGKVVDEGRHSELLDRCSHYRELCKNQFTTEIQWHAV
jgi:subfamily B ATP-binding cassette protein MsbA